MRIGGLLIVGLVVGVGMITWRLSASAKLRPAPSAPTVVDSVVPRDEALRRFRAGLAPVDSLEGGAPSLESLVRKFVRALEARDTATLKSLVLSQREFAYLYYPTNPQSLPPYDLSPDLFWFLTKERGLQGLAHLLAERAGAPLRYRRTECPHAPSHEGENTVFGPCLVERADQHGRTISERLFGLVIRRGGQWKFMSYANKLD